MKEEKEENEEKDEVTIEPESGRSDLPDEEVEKTAENKIAKMREEIAACRKESREYMDGWQRAKADYVNALKRFDEEKKGERERGVVEAVNELFPAFDAIERSKEHGDMPKGFSAIVRQFETAFASLGLKPIGEVGEAFDIAFHEALGTDLAKSAAEDNTVSAVLERGWRINDKIIRPAKVRVACLPDRQAHFASGDEKA